MFWRRTHPNEAFGWPWPLLEWVFATARPDVDDVVDGVHACLYGVCVFPGEPWVMQHLPESLSSAWKRLRCLDGELSASPTMICLGLGCAPKIRCSGVPACYISALHRGWARLVLQRAGFCALRVKRNRAREHWLCCLGCHAPSCCEGAPSPYPMYRVHNGPVSVRRPEEQTMLRVRSEPCLHSEARCAKCLRRNLTSIDASSPKRGP